MFGFVILNYGNFNDTISCIRSIYKNKCDYKVTILVVDNNSMTNSNVEELSKYNCDYLPLSRNYGFAKANNLGIKKIVELYNPDFVCVFNNDIEIKQINFLKYIKQDFEKYNCDILGTRIISPTMESVNPFPVLKTKEEVEKEINKDNKLITIYSSSILTFFLNILLWFRHIYKKYNKPKNSTKICFHVPLHCCAIIFSKKYLQKYNYAFDNRTFLFHEEEFIYQRIIKDKLISVYDPNIIVYHKEGSSLKKSHKNSRLRKLFREKEKNKSLKILLGDMNGVQDGKTKNISNYTSL
jgi:GT2 family glycosyltransferase